MSTFWHGASYYPLMEDSSENWEHDLKIMKKLGINYIRTAEIFNGWDQLEIAPGKYRFDELEDFMDLCEKMEIHVLLGTGSCSPPYWLHQLDPEINILGMNGKRYPVNSSYGWACYNNVNFQKYHASYLTHLVERFKNHKALLGYQINNEIGYPFMPLGNGDIEIYCYCASCKREFRKWVKNKYKTLENLNHAWRWSATNTYHTDWEQVEPPYAKATAWSSVTRWLDWRLFHMETITNEVKREQALIKSLDPDHMTTLNVFYMLCFDPLSTATCIDQFALAKEVDMIAYDVYPGSFHKLDTNPEFSSMVMDHARSISKPIGKQFWLAETEAGPIGGWILGPEHTATEADILRYQMDAIGHDAKAVMYQLFKEYEFQPLHFGGVITLEGEETDRCEGVRKVSDFVEQYGDFISRAQTAKGEVAILVTKENQIVFDSVGQQKFLIAEIRGIYCTLTDMGYQVDFITDEHLTNGYALDYSLICAPALAVVQEKLSENIAAYIRQGGVFLTSARFSYMEDHGWYSRHMPSFDLPQVFGLRVMDAYQEEQPSIHYVGREFHGFHHREKIVANGAEVLGTFTNGWPAVTSNSFGKGKAIYLGTHPGNDYYTDGAELLKEVLQRETGVSPRITTDYIGKVSREISVQSLCLDNREMLIITAHPRLSDKDKFFGGKPKHVTIRIADKQILLAADAISGKEIPLVCGENTQLEVDLAPDTCMTILLEKAEATQNSQH